MPRYRAKFAWEGMKFHDKAEVLIDADEFFDAAMKAVAFVSDFEASNVRVICVEECQR